MGDGRLQWITWSGLAVASGTYQAVTQREVNDNRRLHIPVQKTMSWGIILFELRKTRQRVNGSVLTRGRQVSYVFAQAKPFGFLYYKFVLSPGVAVVHSDSL